jgi:hypothetical protein
MKRSNSSCLRVSIVGGSPNRRPVFRGQKNKS